LVLLVSTIVLFQCYFVSAEPLLRTGGHSHSNYNSNARWGLGLNTGSDSGSDYSWINDMPVEGLLSLYRGKYHDGKELPSLKNFRNQEMVDIASTGAGAGPDLGGRRMSITNAMDILRDRLLRAIKRKQVNGEDYPELWAEPGLVNIG